MIKPLQWCCIGVELGLWISLLELLGVLNFPCAIRAFIGRPECGGGDEGSFNYGCDVLMIYYPRPPEDDSNV